MKRDHWKRTLTVTFWRLLKFLKLKENSTTALWLLKFLILKKGLHCFLTTLKVFNPEKRHHRCLKVFHTEKGLHHLLETLEGIILKNDSVTFLKLVKFIKIAILQNAGEQPLVKVAYHIIFMINELHLLWVTNFIAVGIYFLFGTKFSWNVETDTCFNVECMLLGRNYDFLGGCLVPTGRYLSVTTG